MSLLNGQPESTSSAEPRNWRAYLIAGAAVLLVLVLVLVLTGRHRQGAQPGGEGLASPASYAANLELGNIRMSESSNLAGGKVTYLDGTIKNNGSQTLRGVTVQVGFPDFNHQLADKQTLPMNLIRTREPYIDTQPVSAAPIGPGQSREFRLIFDSVDPGWDGEYPELRIISVDAK